MRKPVLAGVLVVLAIIVLLVMSMRDVSSHRVEVCMDWKGRTNCKTTRASTEEDAIRSAITNACAEMVSGVTDTLACERAEPARVTVLQ
jgi:hypothetical protein